MSKISELAETLTALSLQLEQAKTEIVSKIEELEKSLEDQQLPPEADLLLAELKLKAQALDDIVPDVPVIT